MSGIGIQYLGHSAFSLTMANGQTVLIDPFISNNPSASIDPISLKADYILVTHAHDDHFGDTIAIAQRTGATVVGIYEVCQYINKHYPSVKTDPMNIGGEITLPWGTLCMVSAAHSSTFADGTAGGVAAGYVLKASGHRLYHSGDTGVCAELRFIGEYYKPNVSLLSVGGRFTLGPQDVVRVLAWLGSDIVIPMHYNTWDAIAIDLDDLKFTVDTETSAICKALTPNETWHLVHAESSGRASGPESRY
jgi:L-ascorbate metabolism protein UlaG (beta-lactamase superfamily)